VVNATGAATKHALDTAKGKVDFYMSSPILHYLMSNQLAMYKKIKGIKELSTNLRTIFNFPMGVYHCVVYADSGMKTMQDIKGKRVFVGPPGSATRRTVVQLIEAVTGYKAGTDYTTVKLGWDAAAQSFQDGNLDVYFNPTNAPSPAISQMALTKKIRLLGIPKGDLENNDDITALIKRPGFRVTQIKPNTYGENQVNTDDVYTLAVTVGISTNKNVPEDTIYKMTKTFWENITAQYDNTPWLSNISVDKALVDLNMPLHPGAERYYREIGLIK
jgi:TRAP transporter TAXI family solute receptor